ncbi:glycosyl transferase, partial [Nocardia sp. NPDC059246]
HRTPVWLGWLLWMLVALSVVAAAVLLIAPKLPRFALAIGVFALLAGLLGPTVYTLETVAQVHNGGSPTAGPPRSEHGGGPGQHGGVADPQIAGLIAGSDTRWAAAAIGAQDVSSLELSTGKALLAVGGFSGRDDSPTLAQFQQYVADHQIGYLLVRQREESGQDNNSRGGRPNAGQPSNPQSGPGNSESDQSTSAQITAWVKANYPVTKMGSVEVYNLNP